jgi:hypothetical protein
MAGSGCPRVISSVLVHTPGVDSRTFSQQV